jgi:hypothetical protein
MELTRRGIFGAVAAALAGQRFLPKLLKQPFLKKGTILSVKYSTDANVVAAMQSDYFRRLYERHVVLTKSFSAGNVPIVSISPDNFRLPLYRIGDDWRTEAKSLAPPAPVPSSGTELHDSWEPS